MSVRLWLAGALVAMAVAGAVLALQSGGGDGAAAGTRGSAERAADRFLDRYMGSDGRVVRHDQGGDTVSEGQAYAMLLSAATGDERRFAAAWGWTRDHLLRPDGLLAWRWTGGGRSTAQPAADADLDAARSLLLAAERFHEPGYRRDALRLGRAILRHETVRRGRNLVLVAGPWARGDAIFNPSYFSPRAYAELGRTAAGRRWQRVHRSSLRLVDRLTAGGAPLPPDWARATHWGVEPASAPGSAKPPRYSYDAVRVPLRLAESCSPRARRLAARAWRVLGRQDGRVAPAYDLRGRPLEPGEHAGGLVGAAASAHAAGDEAAARHLLDRAERLDEKAPTYYGAAMVALGRVALTTTLLGRC